MQPKDRNKWAELRCTHDPPMWRLLTTFLKICTCHMDIIFNEYKLLFTKFFEDVQG
jgi:hypothetical protein